jgi:hypothetical protein
MLHSWYRKGISLSTDKIIPSPNKLSLLMVRCLLILRILTEVDYMPGRLSRIVLFVVLGLFLTLFFLPQFISFYVDWLWFKDVRFEKIFITKIDAQAITALAGMLAGFLITYLNILFSMRATKGRPVVMTAYSQTVPQLDLLRHFDKVKIFLPIIIGVFVGLLLNDSWMTFLCYLMELLQAFRTRSSAKTFLFTSLHSLPTKSS